MQHKEKEVEIVHYQNKVLLQRLEKLERLEEILRIEVKKKDAKLKEH